MKPSKPLTVKQLIEELKLMPSDAPVSIAGCDCYGDAYAVVYKKLWGPKVNGVAVGAVVIERER